MTKESREPSDNDCLENENETTRVNLMEILLIVKRLVHEKELRQQYQAYLRAVH